MTEIKKLPFLQKDGSKKRISIGSGCVIIKDEKVLLVRGKGGHDFKFPGGHIIDTENFMESAEREAFEETGLKVKAKDEPCFYNEQVGEDLQIILIHYLGDIIEGEPKPNTEIEEFILADIHNLPDNVFNNVRAAVNFFKDKLYL